MKQAQYHIAKSVSHACESYHASEIDAESTVRIGHALQDEYYRIDTIIDDVRVALT